MVWKWARGARAFAAVALGALLAVEPLARAVLPGGAGGIALTESATASATTASAQLTEPSATEPAVEDTEGENVELTDAEFAGDEAALAEIEGDATLDMQAKLDAAFKRYQTLGAVVCVIENGAVTHTYRYGSLDRDGTPITENTLFRIGSISKMISAMGVMRLVEDGLVTLDGDLSDAFGFRLRNAQYPNTPVTLRQVMSHTAGLRDSGYYTLALRGTVTPLPTLFADAVNPYTFLRNAEAGTAVKYANFGGGLLGSLMERLTGQTVDAFMNQAIFAPLGITAAYQAALLPEGVTVSNMYAMPSRACAATVMDGTPAQTSPDPDADYTLTAGKLTISAPDLAKLLIALCDGGIAQDVRVLRESSVAAMRTAQNGIGTVVCESGRGLCMNIVKDTIVEGRTLYGHGGKANGMLCAAYFDPTDRTGVVILTNGCNNRPMRDGVGMLSIAVIRLCYSDLLDGRHVTEDPWLVGE